MLERVFGLAAVVSLVSLLQQAAWRCEQDVVPQEVLALALVIQLFVWGAITAMVLGPQVKRLPVLLAAGMVTLLGQGLAAMHGATAWFWLAPTFVSTAAGAFCYHALANIKTADKDDNYA